MGADAPTPFPTGLVATKAHFYLAYGVADADWRIAKLDRAKLLASLVPVHTEALALPPQPEHTALPEQRHFFSGITPDVRERLQARAARGQLPKPSPRRLKGKRHRRGRAG